MAICDTYIYIIIDFSKIIRFKLDIYEICMLNMGKVWRRTMSKESKADRFKRIASKRTNEILEKIRLLGNCSNKNTYEYSEEDIRKIFSEIERQLKNSKAKFLEGRSRKFSL